MRCLVELRSHKHRKLLLKARRDKEGMREIDGEREYLNGAVKKDISEYTQPNLY